ncbi:Intraflagellar Transport Protein, partial [Achlya hypogyna]
MRTNLAWSDKVPDRNGTKVVVQDVAFHPDGTQLVAAIGNRVMIYDATNGTLLHSLKGHKDTVYTVDYAHDGKRFASGGADNVVIIWTDKAEGILKYTHNESIQKVAYNPQSQCLASCTAADFGLWSPEQKSVAKHKVVSKILCASWSIDGEFLALGMFNGQILLRDKQGGEKALIERSAPIWTICWSPCRDDQIDTLAVGCWDRTMSFYQSNGQQIGKDRKLQFDPCSVSYYHKGKYLIVSGSHHKASLYTKEGIFLSDICDTGAWVWVAKARPKTNAVAIGSDDGTIAVYNIVFGTVHGIFQERYSYRENMTDVIVQHLMTDQKVRIKSRDYVKKIAVYRDRLAVQLSDRIIIYELSNETSYDMHYRVRERIQKDLPCSLLVVTSLHFILCQQRKLQQYNFSGKKEREWILEAPIRYITVTGGAKGKEGLLVGLKDGSVLQIFIDNPFPIPLIKQANAIVCLDISAKYVFYREKLAVVDDCNNCLVYNLVTKELLYEEKGANSVAWNNEFEDMLCFAGNNQLKIKTGNFPVHSQRMQGFVVGFTGSKVFCLHALTVQAIDVPQSAPLYRYVEQGEFDLAYAVACLGVTESDWRFLAWEALKHMTFDIARKGFVRVRDIRYIELVNSLEATRKAQEAAHPTPEVDKKNRMLMQAEILAYQGKFQLAAKLLMDCDEVTRAIQMFSDLRMWDEAKRFAAQSKAIDVKQLVQDQAKWAEDVHDWRAASEMYLASGNLLKAVQIMGARGWHNDLVEVVQRPEAAADNQVLALCADFLYKAGKFKQCRDVYVKIGDFDSLLKMHIDCQEWEEAVRLAQKHKDRVKNLADVYVPYAEWLATQDRFEDALGAYTLAKRPDQCMRLLAELIASAVAETRFKDASYYHWRLCDEMLGSVAATSPESVTADEQKVLVNALQHEVNGKIYYAYSFVFAYTDEPFTTLQPETLFHASRFLLNVIGKDRPPPGISLARVVFTLAQHAQQLEAFKLARQMYERLHQMRVRPEWQQTIDLTSMVIQTKPYSDRDDLLPIDYRSSSTNPLLHPSNGGDVCVVSGHPFVRSFLSFDNLPLVEFAPTPDLSDEEAVALIETLPSTTDDSGGNQDAKWRTKDTGNGQSMQLNDHEEEPAMGNLFERALNKQSGNQRGSTAAYRVL